MKTSIQRKKIFIMVPKTKKYFSVDELRHLANNAMQNLCDKKIISKTEKGHNFLEMKQVEFPNSQNRGRHLALQKILFSVIFHTKRLSVVFHDLRKAFNTPSLMPVSLQEAEKLHPTLFKEVLECIAPTVYRRYQFQIPPILPLLLDSSLIPHPKVKKLKKGTKVKKVKKVRKTEKAEPVKTLEVRPVTKTIPESDPVQEAFARNLFATAHQITGYDIHEIIKSARTYKKKDVRTAIYNTFHEKFPGALSETISHIIGGTKQIIDQAFEDHEHLMNEKYDAHYFIKYRTFYTYLKGAVG